MYLKDKAILLYRIKNVILTIAALFLITMSVMVMVSLMVYYRDRLEVVLTAKATPECIVNFIIGVVLLLLIGISKRMIGDARFYSGYFELDLNGYIKFADLAAVTGKSVLAVKIQLFFMRIFYMKKFDFQVIDGEKQIVLYSKVCVCECKNCGAHIEKRIYFTGICPYCDSSDLFAKVLTDNRFYSIDIKMPKGRNRAEYYQTKGLMAKLKMFCVFLAVYAGIMLIAIIAIIDQTVKYNDMDYLRKVMLTEVGKYSFDLIRADLLDTIIAFLAIFIFFAVISCLMWRRVKSADLARKCSDRFAGVKRPFIPIKDMLEHLRMSRAQKVVKKMRRSLQKEYLCNCTFEVHDSVLKVALAKSITKDKCPTCMGAITGAVDENYQCRFCGNIIMDVVQKKA